jgi:hypothetical protein
VAETIWRLKGLRGLRGLGASAALKSLMQPWSLRLRVKL